MFNKRLEKNEKQKGLLKRLKNIEDKTDEQLEKNKDSQLGIKSIGYAIKEKLSQEAKNMFEKLNYQEKLINYRKLDVTGDNKVDYDFTNFSSLIELFKAIYYGKILISGDYHIIYDFNDELKKLERYRPRSSGLKKKKNSFNQRTKFL